MRGFQRKSLLLSGLCGLLAGCHIGNKLEVEPSKYELTPEARAYADQMDARRGNFELFPMPYVSEGRATSQRADHVLWLALYFSEEEFGKFGDEYAHQSFGMLFPVLLGIESQLFDSNGKRIGSRSASEIGVFLPFPAIEIVDLALELTENDRTKQSFWDVGLEILSLPWTHTSLLKLSTAEINFFFLPLWRKDRSPIPIPPKESPNA